MLADREDMPLDALNARDSDQVVELMQRTFCVARLV